MLPNYCYFLMVKSTIRISFSLVNFLLLIILAVQDERGPRKSKTSKMNENNTIIPKNWRTRSKI